MSNLAPGWYDDGSGTQRWWDGNAWTEHVGQPAVPPATPKSRKPLIIAAAAAALAAAVVVTLVVVLTGSSNDSPADAVKKAYAAQSCGDLHQYMTDSEWSNLFGTHCTDSEMKANATQRAISIRSTSTSGNTATVTYTLTVRGNATPMHRVVNLLRIGDQWKIDHFNNDSSQH